MDIEIKNLCAKPHRAVDTVTEPLAAPIYPATVYRCDSPDQASKLLAGETPGFVYSRDGHPNAQMLADRCAELHSADWSVVTGSGMSALALALVALMRHGDHVVIGDQLYGKSSTLFANEAERLGINSTAVDMCNLDAVAGAITDATRMVVVETIANPMLRVADLAKLAEIAHAHQAMLLVDNTFASPAVCRPVALGADIVMESMTKIMNGHSDVMLGLLCGRGGDSKRVQAAHSNWGFFPSPFDCWLAARGIGTLALRVERASANAAAVAEMLAARSDVASVSYPGLPNHVDHEMARRQFQGQFGNMVSFTLPGDASVAAKFIRATAETIPFCPSLGELSTTMTHPESTSHRLMTPEAREALGIRGGTIRLSVGIESTDHIIGSLAAGLDAVTSSKV